MKVFLGGTTDGSTWRDEIIPKLKIAYFNPAIANLDAEAFENIIRERENCEFCLYVITPRMKGFLLISEVVDDSNRRPERTLFYFMDRDGDCAFNRHQVKSLNAVGRMVESNGAKWFKSFDELVTFLNSQVQSVGQ